ncbi:MAG: hypothetical protein ACK2U9_08945 [Anaerolineae bacterium]|jgi:anti-sigma-K factor RskA
MDNVWLETLLDAYGDYLGKPEELAEKLPSLSVPERAELASFLQLTSQLKMALAPKVPDPEFRENLRQSLLVAAGAEARRSSGPLTRRWKLAVAATASGVSVAVGVITVVVLSRARGHGPAVTNTVN